VWLFALAIDAHPQVKHWVRDLDSQRVIAFWPPTSTGCFQPDFNRERIDGRVFAAQYKGVQQIDALLK